MNTVCEEVYTMQFTHKPVLLNEAISLLSPKQGHVIVDGTVGGAGHSGVIMKKIMPGGRLVAIDQDMDALRSAGKALAKWRNNVQFVHDNFKNIKRILLSLNLTEVDGILLDIGVSSHQLDEEERGFSYHGDAPLDMRMNREGGLTAADLVNRLDANELARIIRDYGEELWSRRIAEFIVHKRQAQGGIQTTGQLVDVIKAAVPAGARRKGPHPARRTFQALRIAVNDELGALERAVSDSMDCLKPGGRLVVITFHSLEDRIVKKLFQNAAAGCLCPPGLPVCVCGNEPRVKILTAKPLRAGDEELADNARARSAKLRAVMKVLKTKEGE